MDRRMPHFGSQGHPQRYGGGGNSYYNNVDNSVHDNSSVQYGDNYASTTYNSNGIANIGSVTNANFGTNYGMIAQDSGGTYSHPHYDRGPGNPFRPPGQGPNSGYNPYPQGSGDWGQPWHGPPVAQHSPGGRDQFIQQAEVRVQSTRVQQAAHNPFRNTPPAPQASTAPPQHHPPPQNGAYDHRPAQPPQRRPSAPPPASPARKRDRPPHPPIPAAVDESASEGSGEEPESSDSEEEAPPPGRKSSSPPTKIVLQRRSPVAADVDTDVEEAKKVAQRGEARGKSRGSHRAAEKVPEATSSKGKQPVGQSHRGGEVRPRPASKAEVRAPQKSQPPGWETTTDEDDDQAGGFHWEIPDPDSEPELNPVRPAGSANASKGKAPEVREPEVREPERVSTAAGSSNGASRSQPHQPVASSNRVPSQQDEGRKAQARGTKPSAGSVSSCGSSVPNISVESDSDSLVSDSQSQVSPKKASKGNETFSTLLLSENLEWPSLSLGSGQTATSSPAPPQYAPDPDLIAPSPVPVRQGPTPAASSSSTVNSLASTSKQAGSDTSGDLSVAGTPKPSKGLMGGLKRAFKGSKAKGKDSASEGGVVGATGVRDD